MRALPNDVPSRRKALLIGGGAPNATLMAGALVSMIKHGVKFDVVSTSGAGALIGLLYLAPRDKKPEEALADLVQLGISDLIYSWLPINYKVFLKPGPAADTFRQLMSMNPLVQQYLAQNDKTPAQQLLADWMMLLGAAVTPSDVGLLSRGLCANVPFAEDVIDFTKLPHLDGEFYVNAYNVTQGKMAIWGKRNLTPAHFRAALSFPLIYSPTRIDGDDYIEGAAIDTINFRALLARPPAPADGEEAKSFFCNGNERQQGLHEDLDTLVVFDILGSKKLIQPPRHLYDAWVHSIITPLVEIARDDVRLFDLEHNRNRDGTKMRRLLKVPLLKSIKDAEWPHVMDWSESNLRRLYTLGQEAGDAFCHEYRLALGIG